MYGKSLVQCQGMNKTFLLILAFLKVESVERNCFSVLANEVAHTSIKRGVVHCIGFVVAWWI